MSEEMTADERATLKSNLLYVLAGYGGETIVGGEKMDEMIEKMVAIVVLQVEARP